jgi:hypothetical protein
MGRLSSECYPVELEELFADLRSGVWEAKGPRGLLPMHFFASEWRTLLAAGPDFNGVRFWVRDKNGLFCGGDIEVRPTALDRITHSLPYVSDIKTQQVEPETKTATMSPVELAILGNSHDWLIELADPQLQEGLPKYLGTVESHKRAWEEAVLVEGRRALRQGLSQKEAIDEILAVIRKRKLTNHGPANGQGAPTIKQRLQGKRGGDNIKRYFVDLTH